MFLQNWLGIKRIGPHIHSLTCLRSTLVVTLIGHSCLHSIMAFTLKNLTSIAFYHSILFCNSRQYVFLAFFFFIDDFKIHEFKNIKNEIQEIKNDTRTITRTRKKKDLMTQEQDSTKDRTRIIQRFKPTTRN